MQLLECCCWSMKVAISFLYVLLRDRMLVAESCQHTRLASFNLRLFQSYYLFITNSIEKQVANQPSHLLECCCSSMKVAISFLYVLLRDRMLTAESCQHTRLASFNLRVFFSRISFLLLIVQKSRQLTDHCTSWSAVAHL